MTTEKLQKNLIPDNAQISAQLKRIIDSDTFNRSKVNSNLLSYLVQYALVTLENEGKIKGPKEIEIAIEVFNKGDDYNPTEDSFVRVYISKLRKKLEVYYQTEGKNEEFRIIIPSGGYELSFVTQKKRTVNDFNTTENTTQQLTNTAANVEKQARNPKSLLQQVFLYPKILYIVLMISLSIHIFSYFNSSLDQGDDYQAVREHPLWQDLLNHSKPTLIVIGDFFVIGELDSNTGNWRAIIDFQINNNADLKNYIENYPAKKDVMHQSKITYLSNKSAFSIKHLLPLFNDLNKVDIRLVSDLSPSDLREYNLIYIGEFKTLGPLSTYFRGTNYSIIPRSLTNRSTKKVFDVKGVLEEHYTDYGLFAKFSGPNKNLVFTFAGFSDASISQMTEFVTNVEHLNSKEFKNNIKTQTYSNVELLFSTTSFNRTGLGIDIIEGGKINPDAIWTHTK